MVLILVVVALGVAGLLIGQTLSGGGLFEGDDGSAQGDGGSGSAQALPVAQVFAFDPEGDHSENDAGAPQAVDGDAGSAWQTEGYDDPLEAQKGGVGIIFVLEGPATLDQLQVTAANNGWTGEVYVADQAAADLSGWGQPVATVDDGTTGTTDVALDGAQGTSVLLWLTSLGDPVDDGRFRGQISEVVITGTPG